MSYGSVLPENALRVVIIPSDCYKSAIPVMESFFART
nr:MAG TPA: hypothetical protein [Caudoviricetes sp.]